MKNSALRNPNSTIEWLPDMDLNHDKQIQSLLCYRYTIGQAGASDRLKGFTNPSSQQTASVSLLDAHPHPSPLPRGEGEATHVAQNFARQNCNHRLFTVCRKTRTTSRVVRVVHNRRMILPLLGERAGVRADVTTNSP